MYPQQSALYTAQRPVGIVYLDYRFNVDDFDRVDSRDRNAGAGNRQLHRILDRVG